MMSILLSVSFLTTVLAVGVVVIATIGDWLPSAAGLLALGGGLLLFAVAGGRERVAQVASKNATRPRRVLIVGAGAVGQALAESLECSGNYHIIGFVDDEPGRGKAGNWPILGTREATASAIEHYAIDEVFLAYAPTWQQQLADELTSRNLGVRVNVVPSPFEALMHTSNVQSLGDIAVVQLTDQVRPRWKAHKRVIDVGAALLGLILLAPAMLVVALLIRLTSRGPIIFAQERVGRFGKPFTLYKFRTMVHDAEAATGPVLSRGMADDRLTPLGRWLRACRLDEIPQLWNVLRGEMSMVGPRPERPCFVEKYESWMPSYGRRHQVQPGLTGLAQVCAGYHTDPRDKLRFDLIYVSHQSLWLDLSILLRTVLVVFQRRGS